MAKISKYLHTEILENGANIWVIMEDGTEGYVHVAGDCEVYLHHGKIKVFVKKRSSDD